MQESREHIKTRMLRNAARAWGYAETEPESNFDPLVSMLLTSCSIELEKISGEIQGSRARVLERLVQLLSPDAFTGPLPAHAIGHAMPIDKSLQINEDEQYYITRKTPSVTEGEDAAAKDIFFSPSASFRLNRSAIRFMASGNTMFRINNGITKEMIAQAEPGKNLPDCSLWLAIDEPGVSLNDSLFYFDLRNDAARQLFYHQLPKAKWYWNEEEMDHVEGYGENAISGEQLDLKTILNRDDDITSKIKKQVNAFYKPFFVTLRDTKNFSVSEDNGLLWGMINEVFANKATQALLQMQPLRWICIDFPQTISNTVLQDVICVMNSFPVFNRRMHDLTHRLQDIVNIIPLQTEDIFLDLDEVSNDEGKILNTRSFANGGDDTFGILLRNGGVGRFDERDASAMVNYIVQLLRDESVAFSSLGNDFMNREMKQIQQIINRLEQRLFSDQQTKEQIPYLMIRNNDKSPWQNVFLRYWSTCGMEANHIKAGNQLRLYKGTNIQNNQVTLVTTTQGGRNKLGTTESVLAYKSALLSKDRLITQEDIRAFCRYQLGSRAHSIDINKGIMIHPDQQKGFVKTLDVKIGIERREYDTMKENGEIAFWTDNLKIMLEQKSVTLFPYRVFIEQTA
ncbi:MAG: hypothetical protein QM802_03525 [Agriterribacter sp.]